ncbi:NACHT domain-containing protein [Candidatus Woesearchaeota archaeon]|nr:MAG: NACHT domain-containing protein [Candidatus Woesearchaeota archaeon]
MPITHINKPTPTVAMGLFDDVLKEGESLIRNENALDYEFLPKLLPFREREQEAIARAIAPLLQGRNGRNIFIHGPPGIGKTAAVRHVLKELEEEHDEAYAIYINCWQTDTSYKVYLEMCDQLGFKFTQNKNTSELLKVVASIINKKAAVIVFDEIDKAAEFDFLYSLIQELLKKSIILITNYKSWLAELDERIKSRLTPELLAFKEYTGSQTLEILRQRRDYAFPPGVWDTEAFSLVAQRATAAKDIRTGLFLMREAAAKAEAVASKKITLDHVKQAIAGMDEFTIKNSQDLKEDERAIYDIVKAHSGKKIGDLYKLYKKAGGEVSYKTFQRKIAALDEGNFVTLERQTGEGGNTTIVHRKTTTKLTEF